MNVTRDQWKPVLLPIRRWIPLSQSKKRDDRSTVISLITRLQQQHRARSVWHVLACRKQLSQHNLKIQTTVGYSIRFGGLRWWTKLLFSTNHRRNRNLKSMRNLSRDEISRTWNIFVISSRHLSVLCHNLAVECGRWTFISCALACS